MKELLKEELCGAPYASISIFVMMNDPKGFSVNAPYFDKALQNLEATEYEKFKNTISDFKEFVE